MKRNVISALALSLMIIGAWLLVRSRPGRLPSDQAGVAYIEQADGTVRRLTENRPDARTQPVSTERSTERVASGDAESDAVAAAHAVVVPDAQRAMDRRAASGKRAPKGSEEPWLSQFELTERSGKLISSQSFLGQPYVVGFFYATCPSICVRQNEKFKILQDKFRGQPIRLVEISCDPEVDRPEVLAEYADRFGADPEQWLFFTGEMDYISRVGSEMYKIGVMRRGHPEKFALVDAQGSIYGYYTWSDPGQWQALQRDMAKLISELPK